MSDTVQEIAFRHAVDRVNADRDILPRTLLTAQIERIPPQDSFFAAKRGKQFRKLAAHISRMNFGSLPS